MIRAALHDVLACPECGGPLRIWELGQQVCCEICAANYPVEDGILCLLSSNRLGQESEQLWRDRVMRQHRGSGKERILEVVGRHHCLRVMSQRAREFRNKFHPGEWVLDVGAGSGWYWAGTYGGKLILVDFSRESLNVARQLLDEADCVVFIWADAQRLPIHANTISGLWSVQAFQHFPQEMLRQVQSELDRVLRSEFLMEIYNLNPAWLHKVIYCFFRKQFHCRGRLGAMELNRLSAEEWTDVWRQFRGGRLQINSGYSELFFHPDFHLRPRPYPLRLERVLVTHTPRLAALFARQVHVRIETRRAG